MNAQRSIRVAMPEVMYQKLKLIAPDHGDISRLVRDLLLKHLEQYDGSGSE